MPGFPLRAVQMRTEVLADLKSGTQAQLDARSGEIRVERVIVDVDVVALDEFVDDSNPDIGLHRVSVGAMKGPANLGAQCSLQRIDAVTLAIHAVVQADGPY